MEPQKYEKDGFKVRLDIEGNRTSFSPGETIKGMIIAAGEQSDNNENRKIKIKKAEIILRAVEDSLYYNTTNTFVEYKQKILWDEKYDDDVREVPFEIYIPEGVRRKRNYIGKLSVYYWLLEARLDIGWADHLYADVVVQVT